MQASAPPQPRVAPLELAQLGLLVFLQMLPATLLTPAIRPLFALQHAAGGEGAMHTFMSLNMLGAVASAPFIGSWADRLGNPRRLLAVFLACDAILLSSLTLPIATPLVLALRFVEGVAHLGGATLLLAEAAALGRRTGQAHAMGIAGGGVSLAVALGSGLGGALVGWGPQVPFFAASALCCVVLGLVLRRADEGGVALESPRWSLATVRRLAVPLGAMFVGRFVVGCLIVTFALFAHAAHGLADSHIGLLFTALTLPFALGTYPASRLTERVPGACLMGGGALLLAGAALVIGRVSASMLGPVMIAAGLASALIYAPALRTSADLAGPGERSRTMSLLNAAGSLGMVLGPMSAGITSALFRDPSDPLRAYRAVFTLAAIALLGFVGAAFPWIVGEARRAVVGAGARD